MNLYERELLQQSEKTLKESRRSLSLCYQACAQAEMEIQMAHAASEESRSLLAALDAQLNNSNVVWQGEILGMDAT